jgi:hypothetical protein
MIFHGKNLDPKPVLGEEPLSPWELESAVDPFELAGFGHFLG